jgi:hypothetical protein
MHSMVLLALTLLLLVLSVRTVHICLHTQSAQKALAEGKVSASS